MAMRIQRSTKQAEEKHWSMKHSREHQCVRWFVHRRESLNKNERAAARIREDWIEKSDSFM